MIVYPAIDLRQGRVVRLKQGDFAQETRYADDPLELAHEYAAAGARWLHLVDLDAARTGRFEHTELIARIACEVRISLQVGGGVRRAEDVAMLLDAGVARVVIGSVAVKSPDTVIEWLARFGSERICAALDTRAGDDGVYRLPIAGWTTDTEQSLFELLDRYVRAATLKHVLCTDIARDGMLAGPSVALYQGVHARYPGLALQASGGVAELEHVRQVRLLGIAGVVVGRALLERRFGLREALAC
jgi:phosphoribosylformimino-5-aminoimidazole carboxamide ribotide isomerase